ncbi:MAG: hypothetical protein FWE19_06960 [Oscillospiraceae bacterium]|nr:hypothetical protein [Oscillospiraceae bacterium]
MPLVTSDRVWRLAAAEHFASSDADPPTEQPLSKQLKIVEEKCGQLKWELT